MTVTDWDSFFEVLTKSRMLDAGRLARARQSTQQLSEPTAIARRLVTAGVLSRWQATQILAGQDAQYLGKFKLLDELESTATSRVYLAEHTEMNRRVALKTLPRQQGSDTGATRDFQESVAAVSSLNHPHINHIYDVDQADGNYYLIMEHCQGRTLKEIVESDGPLDFVLAVQFIRQAALGLRHAHRHEIVHHDLQPGNLVVTPEGVLKIRDMGLQRLANSSARSSSEFEGLRPELVDYIAPELVKGHNGAAPQADMYALGCTFYFLLTGRPPFPVGSTVERLTQHQTAVPEDIAQLRPDTPKPLIDLCLQMMAKDPATRPSSAQDVADRCLAWIESYEKQLSPSRPRAAKGSSSTPGSGPASAGAAQSLVIDADPSQTIAGRIEGAGQKNNKPLIIGAVAAGLLLVVVLIVVIVRMNNRDSAPLLDAGLENPNARGGDVGELKGEIALPATAPQDVAAALRPKEHPDGLVAFWDFENEIPGNNRIEDRTGNWTAVLGPGASIRDDPNRGSRRGKVLNLDGTVNARVRAEKIDAPHGLTVAAWVRLAGDEKPRKHTIAAAWDPRGRLGAKYFFWFGVNEKRQIFVHLGRPNDDDIREFNILAPKPLPPKAGWIHLAFTAQAADVIRLYQNGKPVKSGPYKFDSLPDKNSLVLLGDHRNAEAGTALKGMLDNVRIYNRGLTGAEITRLYEETRRQTAGIGPHGRVESQEQRIALTRQIGR